LLYFIVPSYESMTSGGLEVTRSHSCMAPTSMSPGEKIRFVLYPEGLCGKTSEGAAIARTLRGEQKRVSEQRTSSDAHRLYSKKEVRPIEISEINQGKKNRKTGHLSAR
jgi:hypothetical protein